VFVIDTGTISPCVSDPCQNGGTCVTQWINATYNTYICSCDAYHTGIHCEYGRPITMIKLVLIIIIISN